MNDLITIFVESWPIFSSVSILLLSLLYSIEYDGSGKEILGGALFSLSYLFSIHWFPAFREATRWGLSILGVAIPLSLGIIAIRYVVLET